MALNALLKSDKRGVNIFHKLVPRSQANIVFENYPRSVISALTEHILPQTESTKDFAPLLARDCNEAQGITIIGAPFPSVQKVFRWMLKSCDGKGFRQYEPEYNSLPPLISAYSDRVAAENVGVSSLMSQIDVYIKARLAGALSKDEVEYLYILSKYFSYRRPHHDIPASEIDTLLRISYLDPSRFETLVIYVSDRVWAHMQLEQTQNDKAATGQVITVQERTDLCHVRQAADQYQILRNENAKFGAAVNRVIGNRVKAYWCRKLSSLQSGSCEQ